MNADAVPRWRYRLANFESAFALLEEVVELAAAEALSLLEKQGGIQRFEFTMELAWKVYQDVLKEDAVAETIGGPKAVIRDAVSYGLIPADEGDLWMDALNDRNRTSHMYNQAAFEQVWGRIVEDYVPMLQRALGRWRGRSAS